MRNLQTPGIVQSNARATTQRSCLSKYSVDNGTLSTVQLAHPCNLAQVPVQKVPTVRCKVTTLDRATFAWDSPGHFVHFPAHLTARLLLHSCQIWADSTEPPMSKNPGQISRASCLFMQLIQLCNFSRSRECTIELVPQQSLQRFKG